MKKRILIFDPDPDVRAMLKLTVARLGHEAVEHDGDHDVDAVVMEPGCPRAHTLLGDIAQGVPVVCLSIYPPEAGLAPADTVAYLMKPTKSARLGAALAGALAT